jgi:hypothetical protein
MHDFIRIALLLPLIGYIGYVLFISLKNGKADHRFYFLEKNKNRKWATRRGNPIEYWFVILINIVFLSVFIYILFK